MDIFSSLLGKEVLSASPVGGGCIGSSYRVQCSDRAYFVKRYSGSGYSEKEAHGLKEMARGEEVAVPRVVTFDSNHIVLLFIHSGVKVRNFQKLLGETLARLHRVNSDKYGFYEDNYIGSTPQKNSYRENWVDFYRENRLDYQVQLTGDSQIKSLYRRLRQRIPDILAGSEEPPCLIHGDLWGGNIMADERGLPVLIDPAVCYGHRELELAMTEIFGGFTREFYKSYNGSFPLKAGWQKRIPLYRLYHILNHLNLFGSGYRSEALSLMNSFLPG